MGRFPIFPRSDGVQHMLIPEPKCQLCSLPIATSYARHGKCYFCNDDPVVDGADLYRVLAAALYIPDVEGYQHSPELLSLKDGEGFIEAYAEVLGYVLAQEEPGIMPAAVVPSPSARLGYPSDGVRKLSKALAKTIGVEYLDVLSFSRSVQPQKKMEGRKARRENMENSMSASGLVPNGLMLAVDDITTSGWTLRETARVLKASGARFTIGLAAGRDARLEHLAMVGVVVENEG